jgi:hypothetical protein
MNTSPTYGKNVCNCKTLGSTQDTSFLGNRNVQSSPLNSYNFVTPQSTSATPMPLSTPDTTPVLFSAPQNTSVEPIQSSSIEEHDNNLGVFTFNKNSDAPNVFTFNSKPDAPKPDAPRKRFKRKFHVEESSVGVNGLHSERSATYLNITEVTNSLDLGVNALADINLNYIKFNLTKPEVTAEQNNYIEVENEVISIKYDDINVDNGTIQNCNLPFLKIELRHNNATPSFKTQNFGEYQVYEYYGSEELHKIENYNINFTYTNNFKDFALSPFNEKLTLLTRYQSSENNFVTRKLMFSLLKFDTQNEDILSFFDIDNDGNYKSVYFLHRMKEIIKKVSNCGTYLAIDLDTVLSHIYPLYDYEVVFLVAYIKTQLNMKTINFVSSCLATTILKLNNITNITGKTNFSRIMDNKELQVERNAWFEYNVKRFYLKMTLNPPYLKQIFSSLRKGIYN